MRTALLILIGLVVITAARADCRGCCSRHGGVACVDGKTQCEDGIPLSGKCRSKGCQACGREIRGGGPGAASASTTRTSVPRPTEAPAYNREDWPHWIDADGDCQDARAEILIRDNVGALKFKRNKRCNVSWGRWICPYTGKVLTKASEVDIDHIVPLTHANATGGAAWPREKKRAFANDPLNLLVVDDATNQAKGDKGPDEWKPPRREYWPEYARKWRAVKAKYELRISYAARILKSCFTCQAVAKEP